MKISKEILKAFMDEQSLNNQEVADLTYSGVRSVERWRSEGIPEHKMALLKARTRELGIMK